VQKNVASQKWVVFAFDETDNTAKTGDAAQITAEISADGGAGGGNITDTNPTELEDGYYAFDITQGESNADLLLILPESSTGNIQVIGVPGSIYTTEPNRNLLVIDANGLADANTVKSGPTGSGTAQTANDNGADINSILTGTVTNAQGADVATDVALLVGTDGKALISTDAQDLSGTLDVNTKTLTAGVVDATAIATDAIDADALATDAVNEIWAKAMTDLAQGAPSATASVFTAINYLYEALRNKTLTTATLVTVMKDDGNTGLIKFVTSDDGTTFTKDEAISGA
jgi:hypothetical protein